MAPCVFCNRPRTNKRGEHVWDDWLNRIGTPSGTRRRSMVYQHGEDDELVRAYPAAQIAITADVVCDPCNNGWMSVLSNQLKSLLEGSIVSDRPVDLDQPAMVTVASFAFMKAAILDYDKAHLRPPRLLRRHCRVFRRAREYGDGHGLPLGLQVSISHYARKRAFENRATVDELAPPTGPGVGFQILSVSYIVGAVALQVTYPRWLGRGRRPRGVWHLPQMSETVATQIWPATNKTVSWPPPQSVTLETVASYRHGFRNVNHLKTSKANP